MNGKPMASMNGKLMALMITTLLVVSSVLMCAFGAAAAPTVVATVGVGTNPYGVGVNSTTNRVYVTNSTGKNVSVINGSTNTVVATVGVGSGPIGVGVNPTTNMVYVANTWSNNVSVINGSTNKVVATVGVGSGPYGVGVNSTTNRVYVSNSHSTTVSVINGSTNKVVAKVGVGSRPYGVGVNSTTNRVYVANVDSKKVSVINGSTNTVVATVGVGSGPSGVGVNPTADRVYVTNANDKNVSVINGSTNTVVATVGVGTMPGGVGVNPTADRIYVANYESNSVSVLYDPVPLTGQHTWYLAEGSTAWGFDCMIGVMNPNTSDVRTKITFMTDTGEVDGGTYKAYAMSSGYLNPKDILGERDFSTKVECLEKKPIAVDRTMFFSPPGSGGAVYEGHASVGVNAPAKQWFLPEGSSNWGFECWLLIQNPNGSEAKCDVTYMIEGEGPKTVPHTVPAHSRKTFNMAADIGNKDASIKVNSNVPVIPERAMYRNDRREGHDSIGTAAPASKYYLAEGSSNWGFTTYVLIQNPNNRDTKVTVTYMTNDGPKPQAPFTMPANSRETIRVNDVLPGADFATMVAGKSPIIAERAMYWRGGPDNREACHDSIGMAEPHKRFYLPTGDTGGDNGGETYTLVMNLNTSSVKVRLTYVTVNGEGNVKFDATIPGQSRMTFNMADKVSPGSYGVIVESLTSGKKIMVERSIYYIERGCGTDTIGGFSD